MDYSASSCSLITPPPRCIPQETTAVTRSCLRPAHRRRDPRPPLEAPQGALLYPPTWTQGLFTENKLIKELSPCENPDTLLTPVSPSKPFPDNSGCCRCNWFKMPLSIAYRTNSMNKAELQIVVQNRERKPPKKVLFNYPHLPAYCLKLHFFFFFKLSGCKNSREM